jgi:type I restriction enzyme M protein
MSSGRVESPIRSKSLNRSHTLFLKRLDELETAQELKANREKKPIEKRFFPESKDSKKRSYQDFRWNRFKNFDSRVGQRLSIDEVKRDVLPSLRAIKAQLKPFLQ